jgi:hypothetical protein
MGGEISRNYHHMRKLHSDEKKRGEMFSRYRKSVLGKRKNVSRQFDLRMLCGISVVLEVIAVQDIKYLSSSKIVGGSVREFEFVTTLSKIFKISKVGNRFELAKTQQNDMRVKRFEGKMCKNVFEFTKKKHNFTHSPFSL